MEKIFKKEQKDCTFAKIATLLIFTTKVLLT